MTKRFGKKLSTYNGGVRVYLPDFSSEDDPYRHNLYILNENCEQENIDSVTDKISWAVSNNSLRTMQLGKEVLDFSAVRNYKIEYDRRCIKVGNDSKDKQLDLARREITELKQALKRADDYSDFYAKEFDTKNHELNALKNKLRNARLRISQLEEKSKNNDSKDIVLPEEWGDKFFQWCEDNLEDRVIFSEMAKRKSKSPKYNDPKTAARCLLWLSRDYWRAKINGKGTALRMTIFDGIKNDQCRAEDRVQIKWKGKNVEAHWHIKNSGNTRDPLRCLRIYYFWDDDDQSIIIVSMPAHAKTSMT